MLQDYDNKSVAPDRSRGLDPLAFPENLASSAATSSNDPAPNVQEKIMELMQPVSGLVDFNQFSPLAPFELAGLPLDPSVDSNSTFSEMGSLSGTPKVNIPSVGTSIEKTAKVSSDVDHLQSRLEFIGDSLGVDLDADEQPAFKKLKSDDNVAETEELNFDELFNLSS